jgi:DNA-binding NarL/FixJ family response regulator
MRPRLMLVDDNAHFLAAARDLLVRQGVDVIGVASNTIEARRLAHELRPDGILVDVDLGPESGFDLAEVLAENDGFRVVLISAYPEADFSDLLASSPAIGFIAKAELSAERIVELLDADSVPGD